MNNIINPTTSLQLITIPPFVQINQGTPDSYHCDTIMDALRKLSLTKAVVSATDHSLTQTLDKRIVSSKSWQGVFKNTDG